ncbi:hypothetical protein D3C85_851490 [compost metagenome]
MTKKELTIILSSIKLAMSNAAKHAGSDRGMGMRYASYDIAQEVWWEIIYHSEVLRRSYPERNDWMVACGFNPVIE